VWDASISGDEEWANHPFPTEFDGEVRFTPDGERLLVRSDSGWWTWDPETDEVVAATAPEDAPVLPFAPQEGFQVSAVAASSDGRLVAVAGWTGEDVESAYRVLIWDPERAAVIATIDTYAEKLAFRPGTTWLVTFGSDLPRVWDARTGASLGTFPGGFGEAPQMTWDPTGSVFAATYPDGVARLFDPETRGETMALLPPADGPLPATCYAYRLAFSPDGSRLATQGCDGVRVWALDVDDLLDIARRNVTRSLSEDECRRYLHVATCPEAP
jgi:WD40 repeat protein